MTANIRLTVLVAMIACGSTAWAQQRGIGPLPGDVWPRQDQMPFRYKVLVLTQAEPKKRTPCLVEKIDAGQINCARRFGHPPSTYQMTDILALIDPGWNDRGEVHRGQLILAAISAGLFCAAIIPPVAVGVAVTLEVFGGITSYLTLMLPIASGNNDRPATLLYLRPGGSLPAPIKPWG